jgi:hypothetical protein
METTSDKGIGVCSITPPKTYQFKHATVVEVTGRRQALAGTLRAREAQCGCKLRQPADGAFPGTRLNCYLAPSRLQVANDLQRQMGGRP